MRYYKKSICCILFFALFCQFSCVSTDDESDAPTKPNPKLNRPIVHYTFKDLATSGTDVIPDGTQVTDHGLAQAHAVTFGEMNSCLDEDNNLSECFQNRGKDKYVIIPEESVRRINNYISDEITISFWAKAGLPHSAYLSEGGTTFFDFGGDNSERMIFIMNHLGGSSESNPYLIHMILGNDSEAKRQKDDYQYAAAWHHYAMTYSDHTTKVFVDGIERWLMYSATGPLFDFGKDAYILNHDQDEVKQKP